MKEMVRRLDQKGYPQTIPSKPIDVTLGLSLIQILEFDTKAQLITLSVWQRMVSLLSRVIWQLCKSINKKNIRQDLSNSIYLPREFLKVHMFKQVENCFQPSLGADHLSFRMFSLQVCSVANHFTSEFDKKGEF